ncbi:NAD(P)/FAD-dependent oxidoreductase [Teredinibacter turnerae]|uniref:Amine oxidase, flavin-containing n=1 Tax=Teredinibacter turnerae (strain ATCC 39867 / T7901) TaxID=377629 RepID=C5BR97_TERTT|nr:FAD-dependent oxidoreductase [Teredinibacter turnerae]ACR14181.1 putative amine oxidase, flavin-containing [Teredinibacter turnerae T7901]
MKIAIIGSGISGLTCAYLLNAEHEIHVFEKQARIGGHTATKTIEHKNQTYHIDTGFIVYNDWTYPNFIKLMNELGIASQPTEMSFSVSCQKTGLEYSGTNLNTLFAQRKNIFSGSFLGMLLDILRFNKEAIADLEADSLPTDMSLGDYIRLRGYGKLFASHYLVPMGSAIWSSTLQEMLDFPLLFFVRFFKNHGLLSVKNRPQWRVLKGGSHAYLEPLTVNFKQRIHTSATISKVKRNEDSVVLLFKDGSTQVFDQVVFACHSDEALALLEDPSTREAELLGAIPYRKNQVVLHTDASILPRKRLAWSSWNYQLGLNPDTPATLSYDMNILQGIQSEDTFVVTLNSKERIDEKKILGEYSYAHPVFTLAGMSAQKRWGEINGVNRTWFCGAYWKNGFHEDGCASAVRVAEGLGVAWP